MQDLTSRLTFSGHLCSLRQILGLCLVDQENESCLFMRLDSFSVTVHKGYRRVYTAFPFSGCCERYCPSLSLSRARTHVVSLARAHVISYMCTCIWRTCATDKQTLCVIDPHIFICTTYPQSYNNLSVHFPPKFYGRRHLSIRLNSTSFGVIAKMKSFIFSGQYS